jgi:hypothetical protein
MNIGGLYNVVHFTKSATVSFSRRSLSNKVTLATNSTFTSYAGETRNSAVFSTCCLEVGWGRAVSFLKWTGVQLVSACRYRKTQDTSACRYVHSEPLVSPASRSAVIYNYTISSQCDLAKQVGICTAVSLQLSSVCLLTHSMDHRPSSAADGPCMYVMFCRCYNPYCVLRDSEEQIKATLICFCKITSVCTRKW